MLTFLRPLDGLLDDRTHGLDQLVRDDPGRVHDIHDDGDLVWRLRLEPVERKAVRPSDDDPRPSRAALLTGGADRDLFDPPGKLLLGQLESHTKSSVPIITSSAAA